MEGTAEIAAQLADGLTAEAEAMRLFALLGALFDFSQAEIYALVAVFTRIGATVALLPGFGEQTLPARIRLFGSVAFTMIVWPLIAHDADAVVGSGAPFALGRLLMAEAVAGLVIGIAIRLLVMALQLAGSIAAQATSVAQIFGSGVTPDPMPAIGNVLTVAGIALALAMGLHVKAALAIVGSYEVLPLGVFPIAGDLAEWGVARAAHMFALAFSLAAPFAAAALVYNVAIGAINRAMPQLMVAFVGAPAITAGALLVLFAAGPTMLAHWAGVLDETLAAPFASPR